MRPSGSCPTALRAPRTFSTESSKASFARNTALPGHEERAAADGRELAVQAGRQRRPYLHGLAGRRFGAQILRLRTARHEHGATGWDRNAAGSVLLGDDAARDGIRLQRRKRADDVLDDAVLGR